ncbi:MULTISPECIES: glycosyltransferase family 9 protein [Pasteurellaceae]|uniref:Glycosyltransferase family 9 protein n=1 Tax=Pasteurella atlantica TaxID=2827233 RepID=A0AAW8CL13_9PAST|nr:glycosyltransferase family 9 protein [Pasteurella atlantica]MBR0573622.1 glycosyltransferase family 9 protein [Pasteurella atlantica]MDP8039377.1 glycosyltransferase family 9 protein [Pasteurella atlantica]MDP8041469.1 glycosyltransferase family 9 protein [Pasteurella atlantica]MDP8043606.1 glycosyltransferase family 9 protein [Pasteurella atlantica]MDP8045690.1 glycosyltransferase family 9 protein [Pasteurella atlantica]
MKKLLVIRNDKLGDFMLAWPSFAMLKQSMPNTKLVALVPPYTAKMAQICPYLDDIIIDTKELTETVKKVKAEQFDGVISFVSDIYNAKLVWIANIPYRLAPATKLIQFLYNHRVTQRRSRSEKAEFEYNLDLVRAFLTKHHIQIIEPQLPFLRFDNTLLKQQKEKLCLQLNLDPNKKWLFVHSSTGGSANSLSLEQYTELITAILKHYDCQVILTAGPNESDRVNALAELINDQRVVVYDKNEGMVDFAQSLACADLFISGSTGPLHISGALNIPTIGFYPSRRSALPIRWQPTNDPACHIAFCPPATKETERDLTVISIAKALMEILPFVGKMWQ